MTLTERLGWALVVAGAVIAGFHTWMIFTTPKHDTDPSRVIALYAVCAAAIYGGGLIA